MAIDNSKIAEIIGRYDEIVSMLSDPVVAADNDRFVGLTRDLGELTPKYETCMKYRKMQSQKQEALDMLESSDDKDMHDLAQLELNEANDSIEVLEKELVLMLAPKDPRDDRSVILEIRAGAGGEEAALFAGILFRMYRQYAMDHGFTIEIIDINDTELGGIKELVAEINGRGAYSKFKFESGVHRVQRVPVTESGGRIHTSTATVAVLPKAEKSEVNIDMKDVRVDVYRSSGAGGQHINKTSSAIRMTHIPTGIVVTCQDERSQFQNKEKCLAVLQSRLWERESASAKNAEDSERRSQVGTGDRSERIRTYNYHEQRVTDHRIGLTLYKLDEILNGNLDEIIDAMTVASAKINPEDDDNGEN